MVYLYILQLEQNKYYIGKTNNINTKILYHMNGVGSDWTNKYKPLKIIDIILNCESSDEYKYIKFYQYKFGIDNVKNDI